MTTHRLGRSLSLSVGAVLLVLGAAAGCSPDAPAPSSPATSSPETSSTAPSSPAPTAGSASPSTSADAKPARPVASSGVGGLDVRYLDEDGELKTMRVEDFPR